MNNQLIKTVILERNKRTPYQTKHIMFVSPSIIDEQTVYFLKDHVLKYINDKDYYCTFFSTKVKFCLEDVSNLCDRVVYLQKSKFKFDILKDVHKMLVKDGIEPFLNAIPELSFSNGVDEIHILGGSETVFPKKTYSKIEPYKSLENSFHDFIEDGHEEAVDGLYTNNPLVHFPISTFMYAYSASLIASILFAKRSGSLQKVVLFCVDPTSSIRFLKKYGIETEEYYIVEDKRGTRNYERFDIAHHIYKEINERVRPNIFGLDESIDFVFGGRLFAENRKEDFNRFFTNLDGITKKIFTPSTMSLKDKETSHEYKDFYPPIRYWDLIEELKNARYTLLMRPWTKNDSVSIRLYEALSLDVLPLVADNYDPESLQIDRKLFSDLGLTVSSSNDILKIINNLAEHDRKNLILLLKEKYIKKG
jgi:hypothetical protein